MRAVLIGLGVLMCVGSGTASANCEHYQADELKKMSADRLALEYCLNQAEIENMELKRRLAYDRVSLEGQRGALQDLGAVREAEDKASEMGNNLRACRDDNALLKRLFNKKTAYKADIEVKCRP